MKAFFSSRYFLWFILALPSFGMMLGVAQGALSPHKALHPTGEFSVRMMIIAMFAGPLFALFPKSKICRWLLAKRRYFGVAAFGYAALHTLYYLLDKASLTAVLSEALELSIWTGWAAFLIFVPLAITSNDAAVRSLGPNWKRLQRLVYAAAILSAAHWLFLEWHWGGVLAHFTPLAVLEAARLIKLSVRRNQPA